MPTIITVEDVEHFRAHDQRAILLARHRQVTRTAVIVTAAEQRAVYTVAGQRVDLRLVGGGYTAAHDCPDCAADRPCFRALAAVDAEGTERFIVERDAVYHAAKVEAAR